MWVGFTCSTWDLLHAGHVIFLEQCRMECDKLIVGLQTSITDRPEKNTPVQTVLERYTQLKACKFVDEIIPYESEKDLENLLAVLPRHMRFLGSEYQGKEFTGWTMYYTMSGHPKEPHEVVYINRGHTWSSTDLRKRIAFAESLGRPEAEF